MAVDKNFDVIVETFKKHRVILDSCEEYFEFVFKNCGDDLEKLTSLVYKLPEDSITRFDCFSKINRIKKGKNG